MKKIFKKMLLAASIISIAASIFCIFIGGVIVWASPLPIEGIVREARSMEYNTTREYSSAYEGCTFSFEKGYKCDDGLRPFDTRPLVRKVWIFEDGYIFKSEWHLEKKQTQGGTNTLG